MKLISARYASSWELKHAFPREDAMTQIHQHLGSGQSIEGMDQLCSALMLNNEQALAQQVQSGEWLLVKPQAYYFDWGRFKSALVEQRSMALQSAPPPQVKPLVRVFRVHDSETLEWLGHRRYVATGHQGERKIDGLGVAHLPESTTGERIELRVI